MKFEKICARIGVLVLCLPALASAESLGSIGPLLKGQFSSFARNLSAATH